MILRRQPPAYSPISFAVLRRAILRGPGGRAADIVALIRLLEHEFGSERAVPMAGTDALQVALHVAMRTVGDTAIALPAFSCFDVATAAVATRGRLRFYDVDPSTLGPDMGSLERVLARGTRIVLISPLYGLPVDWEAISDLLARHGAIPVEDARSPRELEGAAAGSRTSERAEFRQGWTGRGGLCLPRPVTLGRAEGPTELTVETEGSYRTRVLGPWPRTGVGRPACGMDTARPPVAPARRDRIPRSNAATAHDANSRSLRRREPRRGRGRGRDASNRGRRHPRRGRFGFSGQGGPAHPWRYARVPAAAAASRRRPRGL